MIIFRNSWIFLLYLCGFLSVWADDALVTEMRSWDGASVFIARADLSRYELMLLLPSENSVQSLSKFSRDFPRANAVINAGFFKRNGDPAGFLKADEWRSMTHKTRGVIGFNQHNPQTIIFDRLSAANGRLQSMHRGGHWWQKMNSIVGGAPLLLVDGQVLALDPEALLPTFVTERYARSVVCRTDADELLFILVQGGDQYAARMGMSTGLTILSLRQLLQSLHCQDALNLDGGYSSSMIVNGRMVSGHWLQYFSARPVANALALVPRV